MWKVGGLILSILLLLVQLSLSAQEPLEMWVKLSPEIRFNFEGSPIEIRIRPDDHIFLPEKYVSTGNQARADLMVGVTFGQFKLFSYSKYDQADAFWTGARLDFNFSAFDKKLLFNIQERYFWGLNDISEDHYYLVQYIRYRITKPSFFGVLSYGKWNTDREFNTGYWFIGPSIELTDPSGLSLQLAFTKDVFHEPVYMAFLRVGFRINFKSNSKIISIEGDDEED